MESAPASKLHSNSKRSQKEKSIQKSSKKKAVNFEEQYKASQSPNRSGKKSEPLLDNTKFGAQNSMPYKQFTEIATSPIRFQQQLEQESPPSDSKMALEKKIKQ